MFLSIDRSFVRSFVRLAVWQLSTVGAASCTDVCNLQASGRTCNAAAMDALNTASGFSAVYTGQPCTYLGDYGGTQSSHYGLYTPILPFINDYGGGIVYCYYDSNTNSPAANSDCNASGIVGPYTVYNRLCACDGSGSGSLTNGKPHQLFHD